MDKVPEKLKPPQGTASLLLLHMADELLRLSAKERQKSSVPSKRMSQHKEMLLFPSQSPGAKGGQAASGLRPQVSGFRGAAKEPES